MQTYEQHITSLFESVTKLKAGGYASAKELDNFNKIKAFVKLIMSPKPPLPRQLAKALDKMFGEEAEKFEMPSLSQALSKLNLAEPNLSKSGNFKGSSQFLNSGSRMSSLNSSNTLKGSYRQLNQQQNNGSAVNLLGSYAQLLTSSSMNLKAGED
jgi:hypothetical protein